MVNVLGVIGTLAVCVGEIFLITCLSTNYWRNGAATNEGLFEYCYKSSSCSSFDDDNVTRSSLMAVRAMIIIGTLTCLSVVVLALVYVISKLACEKDFKILTTIGLILALVSTVCVIIGVSIYGAGDSQAFTSYEEHLGFSFVLCCCCILVIPVGGLFLCLGSRSRAHVEETQPLRTD